MLSYLVHHLVSIATAVGTVLLALHLLSASTRRSSQSVLAWLLALVFLPPITIPLYLLLGTRKLVRGAAPVPPDDADVDPRRRPIARVVTSTGLAPARVHNSFDVLGDGVAAYGRLLELVRDARRSIHLTVFILGDDPVGHAIVDALVERARAGVRVRVLLDAVGSRPVLARACAALRGAGGEARAFMPFWHHPLRGRNNLRSHRKLAIFDGARVFTGGMNLAVEYLGPTPSDERWRDLAAVAEGPIARDAEALFASDWRYAGGAEPEPIADERLPPAGDAVLQLVPSGPDVVDDALADALVAAIGAARERVIAVTPYYIPDDTLHRALELAARRGVRTALLMPARSNHAIADFARRGLLAELRDAGVELYAYTRGMVHAKAMAVDDDFAFVGSPNFDMRSLYLNYENAIFVHSERDVAKVAAYLEALRDECEEGAFDLRPRPWLLEQLARLVSPEL